MQKKMIPGILSAVVLSLVIFTGLNLYNNVNNLKTVQPINGVIDLSNIANEKYFLVDDWEYYPNKIYSPQDFEDGNPQGLEYVSIGKKKAADENIAYGKGTYRLTVLLSEADNTYSLYLPEIYSASRVYINGSKALDMGSVENNAKEIQQRAIYFHASNEAEIIINVSAFGHFYSGMLCAPAFGISKSINEFRGINVFLMVFLLNVSLICFLMILYAGSMMKQADISMAIFMSGALSVYLMQPVIHLFVPSCSQLPYAVKIGSLCAVYAFAVAYYGDVCHVHVYVKRVAVTVAVTVCVLAIAAVLLLPFADVKGLYLVSDGVALYKGAFAIYIFAVSFYSAWTNEKYSPLLIFGSVFCGMSLVFDCIYRYEPIYGSGFAEIGLLISLTSLFCIIWNDITGSFKFKMLAEEIQRSYKKQLEIHKLNYEMLTESVDAARKIRHDMRQHLRVIKNYTENNLTSEIQNYIDTLETDCEKAYVQMFSNNFSVNALLQYYAGLCKKNGITINIAFNTTENTRFPDTDITVLLGNLLENAAEACLNQGSGATINVKGQLTDDTFILYVSNTYQKEPVVDGENFISSKTGVSGIGLRSVNYTVNKYNGIIDISYGNNVFEVSLNISL